MQGHMCSLFSATVLGDKREERLQRTPPVVTVPKFSSEPIGLQGSADTGQDALGIPPAQMQCLRGLACPHFPILEVILTLAPLSLFLKVNLFYSSHCAKYVSPQTGTAENRAAVVERHKSVPPAGFQLPSVRIIVQENSDVKVVLSCFFF